VPSYGDIATVRSLQAGRRRWFAVRSQPSKKQDRLHGVSAPRDAVRARVYGVRADDAEAQPASNQQALHPTLMLPLLSLATER
jgi:hypothetical protein